MNHAEALMARAGGTFLGRSWAFSCNKARKSVVEVQLTREETMEMYSFIMDPRPPLTSSSRDLQRASGQFHKPHCCLIKLEVGSHAEM